MQDPLQSVNKWTFPAHINTAWISSFTEGNIKSGFAACGIYPFNKDAVSKKAYAPSEPTDKQLTADDTPGQIISAYVSDRKIYAEACLFVASPIDEVSGSASVDQTHAHTSAVHSELQANPELQTQVNDLDLTDVVVDPQAVHNLSW